MKEIFRDKLPSGDIRTKYWLDRKAGKFDYWRANAEIVMKQITDVVEYYERIKIRLTNRQLYYQLVGKDLIPNALEVYKRICDMLTDMRYAGLIDWESIEDIARKPTRKSQWSSIKDLLDAAVAQFRLPRWIDQDNYVEMYCEKEAGINVLKTISDKYHVYFGFNKGYSSASALYELAQRLKDPIAGGKKAIILYFGDHDPSGLDMVRDITKRVTEFLVMGEEYFKPNFEVVSVALTMDQIHEFSLPANPAKLTDPRSAWYIKKHGEVSWELDAIDALELRRIAEAAVLDHIDIDKYNSWLEVEEKQGNILRTFGETIE